MVYISKIISSYSFCLIELKFTLSILLCFSTLTLQAERKSWQFNEGSDSLKTSDTNYEVYDIITDLPRNYYSFFSEGFSGEHLQTFIGVGLLSAVLYCTDYQTHGDVKSFFNHSHSFNSFCNSAVYIGDGKYHLCLAGGMALFGLISVNKREVKTALDITESLIASGLMVQGLKRVFGRESPQLASVRSGKWRPFPKLKVYQKNQPKYYSFPSGHITSISSTFAVLLNNYPEIGWIKPLGYGMICATGVSLMAKDMHWLSDFPLGIFIGYTFGKIVSQPVVLAKGISSEDTKVNIAPYYNQGYGLTLNLEF